MDEQDAAGRRLVELVGPARDLGDKDGLAGSLRTEWSPECLALLLDAQDPQVVEAAAFGLGLIGEMPQSSLLARLLHNARQSVVAAAEEALWSIWMRAGGPTARIILVRIANAIRAHEPDKVLTMLTELIRTHASYAEAYHQRSQAYYLEDAYDRALQDARRAFELNPWHFGALANQAHSLVALGSLREAMKVYGKVLQLHPRMPGIRLAIRQLRERLEPVEMLRANDS